MKKIHYFAAWSEGYCLEGCDHEHQTVTSAVACINTCGGYVVAMETQLRALTDAEEQNFSVRCTALVPILKRRRPQTDR